MQVVERNARDPMNRDRPMRGHSLAKQVRNCLLGHFSLHDDRELKRQRFLSAGVLNGFAYRFALPLALIGSELHRVRIT